MKSFANAKSVESSSSDARLAYAAYTASNASSQNARVQPLARAKRLHQPPGVLAVELERALDETDEG